MRRSGLFAKPDSLVSCSHQTAKNTIHSRCRAPVTPGKLRAIGVSSLILLLAVGCQYTKPLVAVDSDRTGWVEVAMVPAVSVPRMPRVVVQEGIPAWFDANGYPYYPVTVPPERQERARQIFAKRGYRVVP